MKIECPSCHLTGKVNEVELPDLGRNLVCPRCKKSFHVAKPAPPAAGSSDMTNMCPSCQYSTFTDEMFATCPKCGLVVSAYREKQRQKTEVETMKRDQELLTRSHRNPDLITIMEGEEDEEKTKRAPLPQPVLITGAASLAVGLLLFIYGWSGLSHYYGTDWQAVLSEPLVEPVSKTSIFFRLGLVPWLVTVFSVYFMILAGLMLARWRGAYRELARGAWGGLGLGVVYETFAFIEWLRISSSSPSISYIVAGLVNSLFWMAIWCAPALALLWVLRSDWLPAEEPET